MIPSRDIRHDSFSQLYQNRLLFFFLLAIFSLLILLKLPMAHLYYETVSTLITLAPLAVILIMSILAYWNSRRYPEYQAIVRKFYLLFTLKILVAILLFYIFYSPELFIVPLKAFLGYAKTLFTMESLFFFLSYLSTLVIAIAAIFLAFRTYQKSQNKYQGSIQNLTRKTLYALFIFFFLIFTSSAAAYPQAYRPITDTLGDTLYTMSNGTLKFFKGDDAGNYAKIDSLGSLSKKIYTSISQTSQNISQNKEEFKLSLEEANENLKLSITQSSEDLSNKIKEDLGSKVGIEGGEINGSLVLTGNDSDLTVEGTTTTKDIIPDDTLSYNLGSSDKSWDSIFVHRLIGASPIFVGHNNSQKGLTKTGDLIISEDAEIQGTLYVETLTIAGAYTLPTTDGTANQVLTTNGDGTMTWTAGTTPGGTTGTIQFNSNSTFAGDTELFWDNTNKHLGIGTTTPATELEVSGTAKATAFMLPGGIYLNADSVTTNYWMETDGDIYRETGNIALGHNSPTERLDIDGRLRMRQVAVPLDTTDKLYNVSGDLFWNGIELGENFWTRTNNDVAFNLIGNVGIGTSPTTKLDVAGTVKATNFFDATNSAYLTPGSVNANWWGESGGNIYRETGNVGIGTNSPSGLFHVAATSPFVVTAAGNVGVGTGSPSERLSVLGSFDGTSSSNNFAVYDSAGVIRSGIRGNGSQSWVLNSGTAEVGSIVYSTPGGVPGIVFFNAAGGNRSDLRLVSGGGFAFAAGSGSGTPTEWMRITNAGNVGIGTTSPATKLHVNGDIRTGTNGQIQVVGSGGLISSIRTVATADLTFRVNGSDVMTLTDDDRLGIGTTTPLQKLDIKASVSSNTVFQLTTSDFVDSTTGTRLLFGLGANTGDTFTYIQTQDVGGNSNNNLILQRYGGYVGIGIASPTAKLDIYQGNLNLDNTTNANQYGVISKGGTRFIHNFNYGNNGTVTTDGYNIFIGEDSGNLTMGSTATLVNHSSYNTAIGRRTLYLNTTGYQNTANGYQSLYSNTTGYQNTANGLTSLQNNTTGSRNVALGVNAGRYIADGTSALTDPENSVYLGHGTRGLSNADDNSIVIGYNAIGIGANSVVLGNDSITTTALKGNVGVGTTSPASKLEIMGNSERFNIFPGYGSSGDAVGTWLTSYSGSWTLATSYDGGVGDKVVGVAYNGSAWRSMWEYANVASGEPNLLMVKSGGNVGIGTASPSEKLHVSGKIMLSGVSANSFAVNNDPIIYRSGIDTGSYPFNSYGNLILQTRADAARDIVFVTGATPTARMVISSVGNVGIGTTSPGAVLDVNGGIQTNSFIRTTNYGSLTYSSNTYRLNSLASIPLSFGTNGNNDVMFLSTAGNVGIGTASPGSKLTVNSDMGVATVGENILSNIVRGSGATDAGLQLGYHSNGTAAIAGSLRSTNSLPLYLGTTDYKSGLVITNGGNVGIGTTSPGTKLHVQTQSGSAVARLESTDLTSFQAMQFGDGIGGTHASAVFEVINENSALTTRRLNFEIFNQSSTGAISFHTANNETPRMLIDSAGKVGIGDTTPDHMLDVAGNIGLDASSYINFGDTDGTTGYGFRDNAGTLEYKNSGGDWAVFGGGSVAGADMQVQFNDNGSMGVDADFSWNKISNTLSFANSGAIAVDDIFNSYGNLILQAPTGANCGTDLTSTSYTHYTNASQAGHTTANLISDNNTGTYIQYFTYAGIDFGVGNPQIINKLRLWILNTTVLNAIKLGSFKASNDSTDGIDGTWTTLTSLSGLSIANGWNDVVFGNGTAYRWYKIDGAPSGTASVGSEWEMISCDGGSSYNVGIGITTPTAGLHLKGNLNTAIAGTVSVTAGAAAVTGIGTSFTTELKVGDSIKIGSEIFTISAIASNTALTLDSNHVTGASGSTAYKDPNLFAVDNGDGANKIVIDRSGFIVSSGSGKQIIKGANGSGFGEGVGGAPGAYLYGTQNVSFGGGGATVGVANTGVYGWYAGGISGGPDTAFSRLSAAKIAVGNGTSGNYSGTLIASNIGIGDATPAALLTVGDGDLFQVNSSGAIAAAAGITSSGLITFSALADGSLSIVGGVVTSSSDERKKDKVSDIDSVLEKVLKLDPLIYTWKDSTPEGQAAPNKEQIGFFAQDMEQYFPQLVGENQEGMKGLNYNGYTAVLTKAIQEQQASIGAISNDQLSISNEFSMINDQISIDGGKITNLETLVQTLEAQVVELQAQIATPVDVAQIDLNTQDISFIKTLLGIDPANPTNITLAGQLTAEGIETGKLTIKIIDTESPTIGTGKIVAGETSVVVETKAVSNDSEVFITLKNILTDQQVVVMKKEEGTGFTVETKIPAENDIEFSWWIVDAK